MGILRIPLGLDILKPYLFLDADKRAQRDDDISRLPQDGLHIRRRHIIDVIRIEAEPLEDIGLAGSVGHPKMWKP